MFWEKKGDKRNIMSDWENGFNITKRKLHLTARQDKLHQIEVERARKF